MRVRILLSAYSFGAWRGSEAGVGWNVAKGLAERGHEVTVLTTSEFHDINATAIAATGGKIKLLEWDAGISPADYPKAESYRHWQRRVGAYLKEVCAGGCYDLVHHVTFNQYRNLLDVFSAGLPYVIGPVGGAETVAACLLKDLPLKMRIKEMVRRLPWDAQPLAGRVRRCAQKGLVLASTPGTRDRLLCAGVPEVLLNPIIAIPSAEVLEDAPEVDTEPFMVFYGGGARPEKGTKLLVRSLSRLWKQGVCVPVRLVAVAEPLRPQVLAYAAGQGLPAEAMDFLPFMPRTDLMALMRRSRAFLALNFRDDGCMALLEAISMGIPSVCLDIPSQFWLPAEYATKVTIRSGYVEDDLAAAMSQSVEAGPKDAGWHRERAAWIRREMSWETRISQLEQYYRQLITSDQS